MIPSYISTSDFKWYGGGIDDGKEKELFRDCSFHFLMYIYTPLGPFRLKTFI